MNLEPNSHSELSRTELRVIDEPTLPKTENSTTTTIPTIETVTAEQAAKPKTPKASALEVTKRIAGGTLLGLGVGAGIALSPVTVPLGLLGAGIGLAIGKGVEKFAKNAPENAGVTGALIGGSVGSLLTGALIIGGAKLVRSAYAMKQDRKKASQSRPDSNQNPPIAQANPQARLAVLARLNEMQDNPGITKKLDLIAEDTSQDPLLGDLIEQMNKEINLRNELFDLANDIEFRRNDDPTQNLDDLNDQLDAKLAELQQLEGVTDELGMMLQNEDSPILDNPLPNLAPAHQAKMAAIAIMDDYISEDAGKSESAENTIKGLSQENRKTLLALFDGQFIPEKKLINLERALNQPPKESGAFSSVSHAIQNKLGSRISSMDVIEQLNTALNAPALANLDATYATDGKGILDIAYANATTGTLYVVDGTGHDNPIMAAALKNVFDPFTANYERAIQEQTFATVEECQTFVIDQLKQLRTTLANSQDPVYAEDDSRLAGGQIPNNLSWDQFAPIGSLAQIVNIDGRQHVVHVKNGDMMLVIKKNNGDIVLGDVKLGRNSTLGGGPLRAEVIEVEPGDQIMLMTDGIGEYLPKENLEETIKNNSNPLLLKDELKNAVIEYGVNNSKNEANANAIAANGSDLHYHDSADEKNYDDVGFSWLKVS